MSVQIEEVFDEELGHSEQHAPQSLQAAALDVEHSAESFHDAGGSSSEDEWQDVTEHFDTSHLPTPATPSQPEHVAESYTSSATAAPIALDPQRPGESDLSAHGACNLGSGQAPATGAPTAPQVPNNDTTGVKEQPEALLRAPDDFWDNARPHHQRYDEFGAHTATDDDVTAGDGGGDATAIAAESETTEETETLTVEETEVGQSSASHVPDRPGTAICNCRVICRCLKRMSIAKLSATD